MKDPKNESKRDLFKRIAERRTKEILHKIRVLGNCASKSNYEYTESDIEKIFSALENQLRDTKALFKRSKKDDFSL